MILLLLKEMEVNCLLFIYCMKVIDIGLSVAHWSGKKMNFQYWVEKPRTFLCAINIHSFLMGGTIAFQSSILFFRPVSYRSEAKWWRYESFSHLRKIKFWGHRQNVAQLDTWISLQMVHLKAVWKVMKYGTPIRLCTYTYFYNTVYTYMQLEILINFLIFMPFNISCSHFNSVSTTVRAK